MRKQVIAPPARPAAAPVGLWLDVRSLARVEVTSEVAGRPVESIFLPGDNAGWRAGEQGRQTVRLHFDAPQTLRRILLRFAEHERARTQEFVLRWSADGGATWRDIVRQRFNFAPPGTTREIEDLHVELAGVVALELVIDPEVGGGAVASLEQWLLA